MSLNDDTSRSCWKWLNLVTILCVIATTSALGVGKGEGVRMIYKWASFRDETLLCPI